MTTSPNALPDIGRYAAALQGLQNIENGEILRESELAVVRSYSG